LGKGIEKGRGTCCRVESGPFATILTKRNEEEKVYTNGHETFSCFPQAITPGEKKDNRELRILNQAD